MKYYIYEHRTSKGELFYIGKGTYNEKYAYGGFHRAFSQRNRTNKWREIAKFGYKVNIIFRSDNENFILEKENELWADCPLCVNKQLNKKFLDYAIVKIDSNLAILNIFNNTYLLFFDGRVLNSRGKQLIGNDNGKGYKLLTFTKGTKNRKNLYIHRLIAEAFIPNPNNYPVVNHKDLDRENNRADNLEFTTQEMNIKHSVNLSSYTRKDFIKPILQFSKDGIFIKEWKQAKLASNFYNCTEELIQQAAQQKNIGKTPTGRGFLWIYKKDYEVGRNEKFTKSIKRWQEKNCTNQE